MEGALAGTVKVPHAKMASRAPKYGVTDIVEVGKKCFSKNCSVVGSVEVVRRSKLTIYAEIENTSRF